MKLSEFEKDILRCLNGEDVPRLAWGAAMGEAIEHLSGRGYVRLSLREPGSARYVITPAGRAALGGKDG